MKPQIKISIAPAPLEQVLTAEFEAEQRKLLALHHAAPELLDALKDLIGYAAAEIGIPPNEAVGGEFKKARAAIAKAEGK
jgi:hypothetical protein